MWNSQEPGWKKIETIETESFAEGWAHGSGSTLADFCIPGSA